MPTPKELRKSLRNVVLELLPELLKTELFKELEKHVKAELAIMHERQKDTLSYLVRQVTTVKKD